MKRIDDAFDELMRRHPRLFRGKRPQCHCDLPAGWLELADRLCSDLEQIAGARLDQLVVIQMKEKLAELRTYFDFGGQSTFECDLFGAPYEPARADPPDEDGRVRRIRSSPGSVHFSLVPNEPTALALSERIEAAERESHTVCAKCGAPGRLRVRRESGYLVVACPRHARDTVLPTTWRKRQAAAAAKKKEGGDDTA